MCLLHGNEAFGPCLCFVYLIMRFLTTILAVFLINLTSCAQEEEELGTAVYLELGGKGFFSANADLRLGRRDRLGMAVTLMDHEFAKQVFEENYPTQTLPTPGVIYMHLFGKERHFFEAGVGCSISPVFWKAYSPYDSPLTLHGVLGYRYQRPDHFFFRAGFTPFYRVNWMFLPLVGLSLGYSW